MMRVGIMMRLIFRCRHHDECRHYDENRHHDESEHNDGRVEPYLSTKVSHTLLTVASGTFHTYKLWCEQLMHFVELILLLGL
jgi:hypothetical protein